MFKELDLVSALTEQSNNLRVEYGKRLDVLYESLNSRKKLDLLHNLRSLNSTEIVVNTDVYDKGLIYNADLFYAGPFLPINTIAAQVMIDFLNMSVKSRQLSSIKVCAH